MEELEKKLNQLLEVDVIMSLSLDEENFLSPIKKIFFILIFSPGSISKKILTLLFSIFFTW